MISEPRTVGRFLDLFHIPLSHNVEQLRDVYLQVSSSCGYDNFIRQAGGARMEAAQEESGVVSRVSFLKDRISFREEHSKSSLEHFRRRLEEVIKVANEKLNIPIFVIRNITIRAVAAAPGGKTASQFVSENLFSASQESLDVFGRSTQVVGVRLQLPPPDRKSGMHQIRVESYRPDPRSLYLEDVATFKFPIQSRDFGRLREEMSEAEEIVHGRLAEFLGQYR